MKKTLIILSVLAITITLFLFAYESRSKQELSFNRYSLNESELKKIKEGDIILRWGYGVVSDLIVKTLNQNYNVSHCAIVSKDPRGKFKVIHSVSSTISDFDGVQDQEMKSFIQDSKPNSIIVVRLKTDTNTQNLAKIGERAQYYLDKKIPFDNGFNYEDSTQFSCNELIRKVIIDEYKKDIYENIDKKNKDNFNFDIFTDTTLFEIIINHQKNGSRY